MASLITCFKCSLKFSFVSTFIPRKTVICLRQICEWRNEWFSFINRIFTFSQNGYKAIFFIAAFVKTTLAYWQKFVHKTEHLMKNTLLKCFEQIWKYAALPVVIFRISLISCSVMFAIFKLPVQVLRWPSNFAPWVKLNSKISAGKHKKS